MYEAYRIEAGSRVTDDPLGRLITSAQAALADVPTVTDYRAKRALIASARVQAVCAVALAVNHLATAIESITEETP